MASSIEPIVISGSNVDLGKRYFQSQAVAGSPAAASETTICTFTISSNLAVVSGIQLWGWAAFTVGTSGTACTLKIRETGTSGTTIASTGATTGGITAANLVDMNVQGFDTAGVLPGQVYVLTLTVTNGAAVSTVSACQLSALVL
jgi:hypothetical protein